MQRSERLGQFLSIAVLLLVAVALRWPTSIQPGLIPFDTNSDLHVLVGAALAEGRLGHVDALAFPQGVEVKVVALPMLLLSAPLQPLLGQVAAFHVGVVLWLLLNGLVVQWAGLRIGLSRWEALSLATVVLLSSQTLCFLGNGQYENVVPGALAVGLLSAWVPEARRAALLLGGALLVAGFSSPYQAIPVVLLALGAALVQQGPRRAALLLGVAALSLLPVGLYYAQATEGPLAPAPGALLQPLEFRAPALQHRELASALGLPYPGVLPEPPLPSRSVGLVLPLGGVVALAWLRRRGLALALALGLVFLAAIGPRPVFGATEVPGPMALVAWLPGIRDMSATYRFATGLGFVAALALLKARPGRLMALALPLVVGLETLLFSPGVWPAKVGHKGDVELEGPVAFWPTPPWAASDPAEWVAVAHDVPVAWAPEGAGAAWLDTLEAQGIDRILVHRGWVPLPEEIEVCLEELAQAGTSTWLYRIDCEATRRSPRPGTGR